MRRIAGLWASLYRAVVVGCCATFVACGGGGGGGDSVTPPPNPPVVAPPHIATQPVSQTVPADTPATFSVVASGEGTLSYQWQRNGVDVAGATSAQHTLTAKAIDDGSVWTVTVRNAAPSFTRSQAATLSVTPAGPGISLFSGDVAGAGYLDGAGNLARLTFPRTPILDVDDSVYLTGPTYIRKLTSVGVVSRLVGTDQRGFRDGAANLAEFDRVQVTALDRQRGILYVSDSNRIRAVTRQGEVSTLISLGVLPPPPSAMTVGPDGSLYFVSGETSFSIRCCEPTAIYKVAPQASTATVFAGSPKEVAQRDGAGPDARFRAIVDISADSAGNLIVMDGNQVRLVAPDGKVSTIATTATANTLFSDSAGVVHGFSTADNTLKRFSSTGAVSVVAQLPAGLTGVALDSAGRIVYARPHEIGRVAADGSLHSLAGTAEPGPATALVPGYGLVVDSQGNVFTTLSDQQSTTSTMSIRKYNAAGQVVPFGPNGDLSFPRVANRSRLFGSTLAIDGANNLYEADTVFQGGQWVGGAIYKVSPSGQVSILISSESAAVPFVPAILTANARGDVFFVSEQINPVLYKVSPSGGMSKVADMPASIQGSMGWQNLDIAADNDGNVYLTSMINAVIHRIQPNGTITVLAGLSGSPGHFDGIGVAARLTRPTSPALDASGVLFIKDAELVKRILPDGTVTTIAGQPGKFGTRLGPLPGALADGPQQGFHLRERLAIDKDGVLYVESDKALLKIRLK